MGEHRTPSYRLHVTRNERHGTRYPRRNTRRRQDMLSRSPMEHARPSPNPWPRGTTLLLGQHRPGATPRMARLGGRARLWCYPKRVLQTTPARSPVVFATTLLGRDLKFFNYSNASIQSRSAFHGLTSQQGLDIAAYIRGISDTNAAPGPVCRPWNPPYQPGAGLDKQHTLRILGLRGRDRRAGSL